MSSRVADTSICAADLVEGLLRSEAYPHDTDRIRLVETHISWVFLTGTLAYKIKKPVALGFLDFSTLERRRHYCFEELRLNRNWAPELYLDVVPITLHDHRPRLGGDGTPVEYAVRMRQFDQPLLLDRQVESGRVGRDDMLQLATEIADRHLAARRVDSCQRLLRATRQSILDNYADLAGKVPDAFLEAQVRWMRQQLRDNATALESRCSAGYFRECHGDLHLANIVRLPQGLRAFDCIDFNRGLREIDVVADYAFLAIDLRARGATELASVFVNRYLEITGDYEGACLLPMYEVYRCLVRAKILALTQDIARDAETSAQSPPGIRRYAALARALAAPRRPILVAMHGFSGSGKTWLSDQLLGTLPAVRLRSDLERKRIAGLDADANSRSEIGRGLYDHAMTQAVYKRLLGSAVALLKAGLNVVIDAAFLDAQRRLEARRTADAAAAAFIIVRTAAPHSVLRDRVQQRRRGRDASEADAAVLEFQLASADALTADEAAACITVDTSNEVDVERVESRIRKLARVG